jgi:hypothetical protein
MDAGADVNEIISAKRDVAGHAKAAFFQPLGLLAQVREEDRRNVVTIRTGRAVNRAKRIDSRRTYRKLAKRLDFANQAGVDPLEISRADSRVGCAREGRAKGQGQKREVETNPG